MGENPQRRQWNRMNEEESSLGIHSFSPSQEEQKDTQSSERGSTEERETVFKSVSSIHRRVFTRYYKEEMKEM